LLQERLDKANPRRTLTAEEQKRLAKLEGIVERLQRGENVQNRQLQTWLSEGEYSQIEVFFNYYVNASKVVVKGKLIKG
jgi:hypothetical protein